MVGVAGYVAHGAFVAVDWDGDVPALSSPVT